MIIITLIIIVFILGIFGIKVHIFSSFLENMKIFWCKIKWAIAALIFYFSEYEEENPMNSGRILAIEPNEDTITGGFHVYIKKKNRPPLDVFFGPDDDPIEKWKLHIGELVHLPCSVI